MYKYFRFIFLLVPSTLFNTARTRRTRARPRGSGVARWKSLPNFPMNFLVLSWLQFFLKLVVYPGAPSKCTKMMQFLHQNCAKQRMPPNFQITIDNPAPLWYIILVQRARGPKALGTEFQTIIF